MAALIDLLLEGKISPQDLILWLDGSQVVGISDDLSHLRMEFVPVFVNYLRDQSSNVLQVGLPSGVAPNKIPSSVRVTRYVSPGKALDFRSRMQEQKIPSKARTLQFFDSCEKEQSSNSQEEVQASKLELVLQEPNSGLMYAENASPSLYLPVNSCTNQKSLHSKCSISPEYDSPKPSPREHHQRGKRQSLNGVDHGGWRVHSSELKHSEQRLSLGDFITMDSKLVNRKKSPLPRDIDSSPVGRGRSLHHQEMPKILDISDQEAFPVVGSTLSHDRPQKRRINPTRIVTTTARQLNKSSPFSQSSKAVFGVPQSYSPSISFLTGEDGGSKTMEEERELLRQERLKRQETGASVNSSGKENKFLGKESILNQAHRKQVETSSDFVRASPDLVTNKRCLDTLAKIYAELILYNMAPSIMVELYYLMQLLTVRVIIGSEDLEGNDQLSDCYLSTPHNCVYFATNVLLMTIELIKLLDKGTLKLLSENPCIQDFSEELQRCLLEFLESPPPAPFLYQAPKSPIGGVSFQTDTDNRNNFPSDQSFHIFRKQRDMFYEMLRIWEENHLTSGWTFGQAMGSRIRQLLSLRPNSTNFAHFARLFQSQLLTMCRGDDNHSHLQQDPDGLGFLTLLKQQHPEKYKRLYERLVTPSKLGGPCPPPSFPGSQEFFKDFIVTASNFSFNQHLKDVLISHILVLNEREFVIPEPEEGDPVNSMVHGEARSVVLNLRLLAKFLGYIEFLPYQTLEHLPENVMVTQISLRSKVCPPLNLCAALQQCALTGQLVVGVTWVVEYLSMVDPVALHTRQYLTVIMTLIAVFKLLYVARPHEQKKLDQCVEMITICCPFISELKNILNDFWLGMGSNKSTNSYRKITPLSAIDKTSPMHSQMQLQLQLEDNFFHNQPSSVRKTTDFVIERVSSNVIKKIRAKIIPKLRESALEQLKDVIDDQMQIPSHCIERTRDAMQKHVVKLSQDMTLQIKTQCSHVAHELCCEQIVPALSLLLPPDISPQGVEVCRKLVSRSSQEKVTSWVQSHLTPVIFSKDLTADSDRLLRQAQKAADFQATAQQASGSYSIASPCSLDTSYVSAVQGTDSSVIGNQSDPSFLDNSLSSPTNQPRQILKMPKKPVSKPESLPITAAAHDEDAPSPSQTLTSIKEMVRGIINCPLGDLALVNEQKIREILEDVRRTVTRRQDVTLALFRALEALTVDLAVTIAVCVPKLMTPEMQKMFVDLWKPVKDSGVLPKPGSLSSILCSRTVMLVAQNPMDSHQRLAWKKIEQLLSLLILAQLLTPAVLLDQCVALLRHTWPQEILSGISSCIEGVSKTALKQKAFEDDSTLIQMLDWVSWVCDQMDDFSDEI
ncbi:codanin-1 [Panulirus ornatus]|uniref:codanin-1 n=1 Tax=Panulirus ornatus TaxID=150431 RepID=UPI003A8AFA76